jgi:hypothetical protein
LHGRCQGEVLQVNGHHTTCPAAAAAACAWQVGNSDIYGALIALTDVYTKEVQGAYHDALNLHIVAFVMCCALGIIYLAFILRPTVASNTQESRRVAELLATLPPEFSVEALLQDALNIRDATAVKAPTGTHVGSGRDAGNSNDLQVKGRNGSVLSDSSVPMLGARGSFEQPARKPVLPV